MDSIDAASIGLRPGTDEAEEDSAERESPHVLYWLGQIDSALSREKSFRKEASETVKLYEGDKPRDFEFNILYANTETMAPALFNSVPRPVVKRRHLDKDPLGLLAAKCGERLLSYMLDSGGQSSPDFGATFSEIVTSALVPGRGVPWVKYTPVFETVPAALATAAEGAEGAAEADLAVSPDMPAAAEEIVIEESVTIESVDWECFLHGYATTWSKVPWVAVQTFLTKADVIKLAGKEKADKVKYIERKVGQLAEDEGHTSSSGEASEGEQGLKTAEIWQIWCKDKKKVFHVCREYLEDYLTELEDPLKLDTFYPCPEPLRFFRRLNNLLPQPLYVFYREQARELNAITTRINKLVRALKVRGFYDNALGDDLKTLLEADDNKLIPVDGAKLSATQMGGSSVDKAIWLMPIEKIITVLQQLYIQRTQVKQVIYEVMGLSDVLRGSSVASETATAQEIKAEWGGLRLKRSQKAVMTCVRDTLRIMLEIGVSQFDPERIRAMTGMMLPLAAEKKQQQLQLQQHMQAAQPGPDGQPSPPPPDLVAATEMPTMEEVVELLRDDMQRKYRIDIETNSTVDAEATDDKKDIAEMMNAIAQFLSGVQPMVENGTLPFEAAQSMLLAVARRYRFGSEVEDKLQMMKEPEKSPDPKEVEKQMAEMQKMQKQLEEEQQAFEQDKALAAREVEFREKAFAMEQAFAKRELDLETKAALDKLKHASDMAQQSLAGKDQILQTKQQLTAGRLAERRKEVETKGKDVVKTMETQTAANAELVGAVKEMMIALTGAIVEGINKAVNTPKTVTKVNGAWISQPVSSDQGQTKS